MEKFNILAEKRLCKTNIAIEMTGCCDYVGFDCECGCISSVKRIGRTCLRVYVVCGLSGYIGGSVGWVFEITR